MGKHLASRSLRAAFAALALVGAAFLGGAQAQKPAPAVWPQDASDLKPDPRITFGVLANGMRYAILPNQSPPGVISIRLRIAAGSMQEAPGQEGLAHMLEHLAFRGSKAYPGDEGIKTRLEAAGFRGGQSYNATTGPQETIFTFDIAAANAEKVAAVMDVLREIVGDLELSQAGMDAERGIVLAEERQRDTPALRASFALNAAVYQAHPAGKPTIGKLEVLQTAPVAKVKAYYDAYYRPERAFLVVVGPGAVKPVEDGIHRRFDSWQGRGPAGADPAPFQPKGAERFALHIQDGAPGQAAMIWTEAAPLRPDTKASRRQEALDGLALAILNTRLAESARQAGAAGVSAQASRQGMAGIAKETVLMVSRPTTPAAGVTALTQMQKQALESAVGQDELDAALGKQREAYKSLIGSKLIGTRILATGLVVSATQQTFMSPDQEAALFDELVAGVKPAEIDAAMRRLFPGAPLVFLSSNQPFPNGEAVLRTAYNDARNGRAPALAKIEKKAWPYETFGPPGRVVETRQDPLGITMVRFANNVRLTIKPSAFRQDQIQVRILFGQGVLEYPKDRPSPGRLWTTALVNGGLVGMTNAERQRSLDGHTVSAFGVETEGGFTLGGNTKAADLDLQLQLLAAYMTAPAWKVDNFDTLKTSYIQNLDNAAASPGGVFGAQAALLLHSGDQRWGSPSKDFIAGVTLDQVKAFMEPILTGSEMEIVLVGNVTPERAIEAVSKTFGAFAPRRPLSEAPGAREVKFPASTLTPVVLTHRGRADQGLAVIAWPTTDVYADPEGQSASQVLIEVFRSRLQEEMRTVQKKTYSTGGASQFSRVLRGYGTMTLQAEVPPGDMDAFFAAAEKIAADLRANGAADEEVRKIVTTLRQQTQLTIRTDAYWSNTLLGVQREPRRLEGARTLLSDYDKITTASVRKAAETWLAADKAWRLKIVPDAKAGPSGQVADAPPADPRLAAPADAYRRSLDLATAR